VKKGALFQQVKWTTEIMLAILVGSVAKGPGSYF
jgi:hypothetical protein